MVSFAFFGIGILDFISLVSVNGFRDEKKR
jgi:hypothetical protein